MSSVTIALAALAAAQTFTPSKPAAPAAPVAAVPATIAPAPKPAVIIAPATASAAPATTTPAPVAATTGAAPASTTPVGPPSTPSAVVLWRNIENGMPVATLRALYPQGPNVTYKADRTVLSDVPVIEGCQAKVNVMHTAGSVAEIVMRGEGAIAGRCSLKIITALSGKYGESLEKDKVRGSLFAREGKNYVWMRDGITLQLKRYTNGPLGGGGLFAASWELRYSANAANIDL